VQCQKYWQRRGSTYALLFDKETHYSVVEIRYEIPTMSDKPKYAVIVTVEGLGTNLVGCYGGAIAPTKNLDSFACRSIVFDQFWSDTFRPIDILESMWTGLHFAVRSGNSSFAESTILSESILERAMLITDSITIIEESTRDDFGSVLLIESQSDQSIDGSESGDLDNSEYDLDGSNLEDNDAEDDQPQFTRLFQAALGKWATQLDEFPILWIHSRGLNGTWDAPYEYRCVMCDEGDPEPPFDMTPARLKMTDDTDPDEVFGLACSLGAQSMVLDDAWAMIEEVLEELGIASDCLQIFAGVQGYPIGEHGFVGHISEALYAETLHLPLIVRPGDQLDVGVRVPFMVQPNSILMTIENWVNGDMEPREPTMDAARTDLAKETDALPAENWPIKNQLAYSCYHGQVHVAVPAWSCRWSTDPMLVDSEENQRVELFATPDDRWQQNEVSQRAQAILEELTLHRDEWLHCCLASGSTHTDGSTPESASIEWKPLSSELTHPVR